MNFKGGLQESERERQRITETSDIRVLPFDSYRSILVQSWDYNICMVLISTNGVHNNIFELKLLPRYSHKVGLIGWKCHFFGGVNYVKFIGVRDF